MITRSDVEAASRRLAGRVRRTPVLQTEVSVPGGRTPTVFKLEQLQLTGSFKARGALNRVLSAIEAGEMADAGIVAASGGNAGLAFAYAAAEQRLPARIFVPETSPTVKVERLRRLGAQVVQVGDRYAEAYQAAVADAAETGALLCHAYDQPAVCAGQGTLALELLEQINGAVDTVLVAVGGGGLMAGLAAALEGRAQVVGVEPSGIPTLHAALAAGEPVDVGVNGIATDSLGATRLGDIAWDVARRTGVTSVLVEDDDLIRARQLLWDEWRIVVEHGAAAAFAALVTGAYRQADGDRVAVILCGANTSTADLGGDGR